MDPELAVDRPPPAQETAAYFLVAEALANAARHAHADRVKVQVHRDEDVLHVSISDNGVGGSRVVPGGGIAGLTDRFEALGGDLSVHDDPCPLHPTTRGTTLSAALPNCRTTP